MSAVPDSDVTLGRLLVEQGLARPEQVEACLADIARLAREGVEPLPTLGALLVRRGILPAAYEKTISPVGAPATTDDLPPEVAKAPSSQRYGRYVRIDRLGAGGMGEVWRAYDTDLRRWVALKFLKADDADDLSRFKREAQVAARLTHPNIAAVYEVGEAQGRHFIAMQLVNGSTLKAYAKKPKRAIVELVRDAARAVEFAHAAGVINRDLKPDNVMVEESPRRVYVMDFGLARQVQGAAQSASGMLIGTPQYMSPEQARGERADARADVYSLGATLYELLGGRAPFEGSSVVDVLMHVVNDEPRPLSIEHDLDTIVAKCMEKERDRRYATAGALADDLDRWLSGEPISARPASLAYRLRKRLAKRKALVAVGGVSLLVAGVLLGFLIAARRAEVAARGKALNQLALTAKASLDAAMAMRRVGKMREMEQYAGDLQRACREAIQSMPQAGAPHYHRGRMLRALQRHEDAFRAQEEALRREPELREALHERGLLNVFRYETRLAALREEWRRRRAQEAAGLPGRAGIETPASRDLEDDIARRLREAAASDLRRASGPVALAILAWLDKAPDAAATLDNALREAPEHEELWELRARLARDAGRLDEAVEWFSRGHERDRGYVRHLLGRCEVRGMIFHARAVAGDDVRALGRAMEAECDAFVELFPRNADALEQRARTRSALVTPALVRGEDPTDIVAAAIRDCDEALALEPGNAGVWGCRGYVLILRAYVELLRGQDFDASCVEAVENIERAVKLAPHDAEMRRMRAWTLLTWASVTARRGGDAEPLFDRAAREHDAAILLEPANDELWRSRSDARAIWATYLLSLGRDPSELLRQAVADCDEALRLRPGRAQTIVARAGAIVARAFLETRRGESTASRTFQEAFAEFDRALKLYARCVEAWLARGQARIVSLTETMEKGASSGGVLDAAISDFDEALRLLPSHAPALRERGFARGMKAMELAREGKEAEPEFRRALEDADESLRINALDAEAWRHRAVIRHTWVVAREYFKTAGAEVEELCRLALEDFEQSLKLNARDAETYLMRGTTRVNLGSLMVLRGVGDPSALVASAIEDFGRCASLDARRDEPLVRRGQARLTLAGYALRDAQDPTALLDLAVADFGEALARRPGRVEALMNRGGAEAFRVYYWLTQGKPPKSRTDAEVLAAYGRGLRDLAETIRLAPDNFEPYARRGMMHYCMAAVAEALADFEKLVQLNPAAEPQYRESMEACRKALGK